MQEFSLPLPIVRGKSLEEARRMAAEALALHMAGHGPGRRGYSLNRQRSTPWLKIRL